MALDNRSIRVADLFCGAGGLSEGFRQAGYVIVAGVDTDPDACATFGRNFRPAQALHADIRQPESRRQFLKIAGDVDVLIGGPPCQAFSQVRNHARLIDDPRNSLYREFVHSVREILPVAFVMENVPGLQQMGVKEQVLQDLALHGKYRVSAQLLDAADFGVPQTRKRLIFIGLRRDLNLVPPVIEGSAATEQLTLKRRLHGKKLRYQVTGSDDTIADALMQALGDPDDATVVNVHQAIGDLAILKVGERRDELAERDLPSPFSAYQRLMRGSGEVLGNTSVPRINTDTVMRLKGLPPGGNYRDLPEHLTDRYLSGELWGPSNGTGLLGRKHYYAYRRLHPSFWSWTLNTKADSVYHYNIARALSVREFARLQSFPDAFAFLTDARSGELKGRISGGAAHSKYRQVGNAVPPLLARVVGKSLKEALRARQTPRKTA